MACRNMVTAKEAKDDIEQSALELAGTGELVVEELDLCSLESVRAFCARVTSRGERVRGVVCNAGVMMCPAGRTRDGFETHIASNHLGHALLTLLLLPALIQNGPSRIVFLSSRIHQCKLTICLCNWYFKPGHGTLCTSGVISAGVRLRCVLPYIKIAEIIAKTII